MTSSLSDAGSVDAATPAAPQVTVVKGNPDAAQRAAIDSFFAELSAKVTAERALTRDPRGFYGMTTRQRAAAFHPRAFRNDPEPMTHARPGTRRAR